MVTHSLSRSFERRNLIQNKLSLYVQLNTNNLLTYVNQFNKIHLSKIQFFYFFSSHRINLLNIKKEHIKKCALRLIKIDQYFDETRHKQLTRS